jgi:hypothetical protein
MSYGQRKRMEVEVYESRKSLSTWFGKAFSNWRTCNGIEHSPEENTAQFLHHITFPQRVQLARFMTNLA